MAIQCKESTKSKRAEPTAGPSEDDRYGPNPIAPHTRLRIHRTDVVGGRTRIMIAGGTTHGVYLDMEGAVLSSTGPIANFRIHQVTPTASYAFVATTVDEVRGKLVTLGPTTRPPATRDQEARVLHVGTEDGQTRIVIGCGTEQGVTLGMRGTLVGSNIDFEIAVVDARKSIAFVKASFDEIDQTRLVTLHAAKPRTAIQRRATGAAAAADVQTTAVAGVASASAALPHLATIQRAFGKHDVSNVRAQVGGPAAAATGALGAQAYATGDTVAFASTPDLHTAAHEAAHAIQQRHGAVGFQGLGAANDEHERHADAVADAVVAGQSAEPILDRVAEPATARSDGAVQAKRGDPARSTDQIRVEVIRLSLRNAQHEIEKWGGAPDPGKVIVDTRMHLAEANATLGGITLPSSQLEAIHPQMEATTRAVHDVMRVHGDRPPVTQLAAQVVQLRTRLHLDPSRSYGGGGNVKASQRNQNESEVVGPVMDLVRSEGEAAYRDLVEIDVRKSGDEHAPYQPDERVSIIGAVVGKLQHHVMYAHAILDEHPADTSSAKSQVVAASVPIQQLRAWIFARQDNARLLSLVDLLLHEFDALRAAVGLESLAKEPVPPPARASIEGAVQEQNAVGSAEKHLNTALETKFKAFAEGAERFAKHAILAPPAPKSSFWEELAKGILISVIGNVIGPVVGALVKANASAMTEASLGFLADATTDSVQAIAGKIADDAFATAASENDKVRNVALFKQGLVLTQAECVREAQDTITRRVGAKNISAAELRAMQKDIDKASLPEVASMAFQHAAHGFALLTSRLGLGRQQRDGHEVSSMDDYFGKPIGGPRFGDAKIGGKLGTTGVGRLRVSLFDDGRFAGYRIETFALHGMVGDLAEAALAHAGYRMDQLALPLEIEVAPPSSGRDATALLAIDERGELRATSGWSELQGPRARARNADFYATPEKLWQSLRRDPIPRGIVERG